jgi:hypothetical protein
MHRSRDIQRRVDPSIAALRVTAVNDAPVAPRGQYVLYWMIAARRTRGSFALDHAIARARELGRPLVIFEPLRAGYRWASDRMHAFVLQGMADNARACAKAGITYVPHVEPVAGDGAGLLAALARGTHPTDLRRNPLHVFDGDAAQAPPHRLPRALERATRKRMSNRLRARQKAATPGPRQVHRTNLRAGECARHRT